MKQNRVVPPSEIERFEDVKNGYFVYFSTKETSLTEDLQVGKNRISLIYPNISLIAQVEQPWQLTGVRVG